MIDADINDFVMSRTDEGEIVIFDGRNTNILIVPADILSDFIEKLSGI